MNYQLYLEEKSTSSKSPSSRSCLHVEFCNWNPPLCNLRTSLLDQSYHSLGKETIDTLTNHTNFALTYLLGPLLFVDQYDGDLRCKHGSRIDDTAGANHQEKVTFVQLIFRSIKNLRIICQEKA